MAARFGEWRRLRQLTLSSVLTFFLAPTVARRGLSLRKTKHAGLAGCRQRLVSETLLFLPIDAMELGANSTFREAFLTYAQEGINGLGAD